MTKRIVLPAAAVLLASSVAAAAVALPGSPEPAADPVPSAITAPADVAGSFSAFKDAALKTDIPAGPAAGKTDRRLVSNASGVRIFLISRPDTREICVAMSDTTKGYGATGCSDAATAGALPPLTMLINPAKGETDVYGAAPDGVTTVDVTAVDGNKTEVPVSNNVFKASLRGDFDDVVYKRANGTSTTRKQNATPRK